MNTKIANVVLLSGFLGSGKTTLLKRILSWDTDLSDTVVLVNEFGQVGIDGMLLKDAGGDVVELSSGCICCTLAADFQKSIEDVIGRFTPSKIFIEASGVADPAAIIQVLRRMNDKLVLNRVVTVIDADYWEAREAFGPVFYEQIRAADLILLNKIDLVEKDKIPLFLEQIHKRFPGSRVIPTLFCNTDPDAFFSTKPSVMIHPISFYKERNEHIHADEHFTTFTFKSDRKMDDGCFKSFLDKVPFEVFRIKGPVAFSGSTRMLNFVGGKSEWFDWEPEETKLAIIGWNIDPEEISNRLKACLI